MPSDVLAWSLRGGYGRPRPADNSTADPKIGVRFAGTVIDRVNEARGRSLLSAVWAANRLGQADTSLRHHRPDGDSAAFKTR